MKYIILAIFNMSFLISSLWLLLYANTYLNSIFISDNLKWKNGEIKDNLTLYALSQMGILIVEICFLTIVLYILNKWILANFIKFNNAITISYWSTGFIALVMLTFAVILLITSYGEFYK